MASRATIMAMPPCPDNYLRWQSATRQCRITNNNIMQANRNNSKIAIHNNKTTGTNNLSTTTTSSNYNNSNKTPTSTSPTTSTTNFQTTHWLWPQSSSAFNKHSNKLQGWSWLGMKGCSTFRHMVIWKSIMLWSYPYRHRIGRMRMFLCWGMWFVRFWTFAIRHWIIKHLINRLSS